MEAVSGGNPSVTELSDHPDCDNELTALRRPLQPPGLEPIKRLRGRGGTRDLHH